MNACHFLKLILTIQVFKKSVTQNNFLFATAEISCESKFSFLVTSPVFSQTAEC